MKRTDIEQKHEKSALPDGKYPICGLSKARSVTFFLDNDHQWGVYIGEIERFNALFNLFKAGKIVWKEDTVLAIMEGGFVTRFEF